MDSELPIVYSGFPTVGYTVLSSEWVGIKQKSGITEIRNCGSGKRIKRGKKDKTRKKG